MKKQSMKKLRLSKETLRNLAGAQLERANGGTCLTNAWSDCLDYTYFVCPSEGGDCTWFNC